MCGIAGYKTDRKIDNAVLEKMLESLYHRGPDSKGTYTRGPYRAGMRRLSINDLKTGDQPLFNEDKSVVLFYNGEIYNSPELRKSLERKGHKFRTHSDGEVICHMYEDEGEDLFEKLDGMFAAALWVEPQKKLILARDIPGEKPLYYSRLGNSELVFASELKSLILFPGLDLALNYQGLWDFPTFNWIPEPNTVYKNILCLPRSHILVCDKSGARILPYRNRFNTRSINTSDDNAVIEETRKVIVESVKSRLLSDVPIGCFLSGGLDSSIVATLAAKNLRALDTFTISFENVHDPYHGTADESPYAAFYAKKLGSRHHEIKLGAEDFYKDFLRLCVSADQPFSVSSGLGIMAIARAAKEAGIKVLLSGDCADECFGGYSWYFYLNKKMSKSKRKSRKSRMISFTDFGISLKERLSALYGYDPQYRAWAWHYYASEDEKRRLFDGNMFGRMESSTRFFYDFKKEENWMPEDFIRHDREFYLLNEMLHKLDRMTMSHSVEGRIPFAAPAVLAHSEKLKYGHMVKGRYLKWVLRQAFRDILPKEIYERPKHGFNVPLEHWFRNELSDLFEESFSPSSNLTRLGIIGKKSRDVAYSMVHDKSRVHGHTILSFVMLNLWLGAHRWK